MPKEPETENFGKTLKIDQVTAADEGTYQCTASNLLGRASHKFHVHVEGAQYSLLKMIVLGQKRWEKGSKGGFLLSRLKQLHQFRPASWVWEGLHKVAALKQQQKYK